MNNNTNANSPEQAKRNLSGHVKKHKHLFAWIVLSVLALIIAASVVYFQTMANKIYIDKAEISAAEIALASKVPGTLEEVMVKEGDIVPADTIVARVGTNLIKTDVAGIIIKVNTNLGEIYGAGAPVVSMVQSGELRVVGRLAEDKGLRDVRIGQTALFKVDAYSGKKYYGIVDEISPTSRDSGVAFNISDKRETKEFNIKVRFDAAAYPELKNGMSAKIWIYKN